MHIIASGNQQEGNSDNSLIIVLAANREYLSNFHNLTGIVQRDEIINQESGYLVVYIGRCWRD